MKKFFIVVSFLLATTIFYAQTPQKFNYQAIARNLNGDPILNSPISLQMSILDGGPNGTPEYIEQHTANTGSLGIVNLHIGDGLVIHGSFTDIHWNTGSHWLKVEIDPAGGLNFQPLSNMEFQSVPYAIFAESSRHATEITLDDLSDVNTGGAVSGQVLKWTGSAWEPAMDNSAGSYFAGAGISIAGNTITNTGDTDSSDDVSLSLMASGDVTGTFQNIQIAPATISAIELVDGAVDSAKLATGAVRQQHLADKAVVRDKLADKAVTKEKLAEKAVDSLQLADGGVHKEHLADKCVIKEKLADKAVAKEKIADKAVDSLQLADGGVRKQHLADKCVAKEKLADKAVAKEKIADKAVDSLQLADGGVRKQHLADKCVAKEKLADKAVAKEKIADKAVDSLQLADGGVRKQHLADKCVAREKLADKAVAKEKIADKAVDSLQLADGGVRRQHLADKAVATEKLADAAATTPKIANGAVNGAKIAQMGATSSQVLKWNGSSWAPATDISGITYTAGTGIQITGNVIQNIGDLDNSPTNEIQTLGLVGNTLSLGNGGGSVNLSNVGSPQWTVSGNNIINSNSGNVGINVSDPGAYPLKVRTDVIFGLDIENEVTSDDWELYPANPSGNLEFYFNTSQRGFFNSATGNYVAVSDLRLKKDIVSISPVLKRVLELNPVLYKLKEGNPSEQSTLGFIAQEVKPLFPELVEKNQTRNGGELYGLNYSGFGVLAIKAIQEQQAQIDTLQNNVMSLKNENEELKTQNEMIQSRLLALENAMEELKNKN